MCPSGHPGQIILGMGAGAISGTSGRFDSHQPTRDLRSTEGEWPANSAKYLRFTTQSGDKSMPATSHVVTAAESRRQDQRERYWLPLRCACREVHSFSGPSFRLTYALNRQPARVLAYPGNCQALIASLHPASISTNRMRASVRPSAWRATCATFPQALIRRLLAFTVRSKATMHFSSSRIAWSHKTWAPCSHSFIAVPMIGPTRGNNILTGGITSLL